MRMAYAKSPRVAVSALVLVVGVFLGYSVWRYLGGGTRVPPTFALHHQLLVAHVMLGAVVMVAAMPQIWPGLRARHPAWHRRSGRVYVAAVIPSGLLALVLGAAGPFGPALAISNVLLASVWVWFTIGGYLAARRRRFTEHRRHMLISVTLALSVITNRIWSPLLFMASEPLRNSVFGGSEEHYVWFVAGVGGWLGWLLPLAAVTWWLRRRGPLPAPAQSRTSENGYRRVPGAPSQPDANDDSRVPCRVAASQVYTSRVGITGPK